MNKSVKISNIKAIQVFDSRGNPTIQVTVETEDGNEGVCMVPSGASTGSFEAVELRDGSTEDYGGKGVLKAVDNVNKKIAKELIGQDVFKQEEIDKKMIKQDGTTNKEKLGANAILGVSIACAKAAANSLKVPLYEYIGGISAKTIPIPMMNILNGGKHSDNTVNIQEFMIVPTGASDFKECMKMGTEIYHTLKALLKQNKLSTAVGDEGGFAPNLENDEQAIELILEAVSKAGYEPRKDIQLALDIASTEMWDEAKKIGKEGYYFWKTDQFKTKEQMIEYMMDLAGQYPILSIEDALAEEDWESWKELTVKIGGRVQLVGDDLFVTNPKRLKKGIEKRIANAILIKPNQIGTLTETMEAVSMAKKNGYKVVISHRSGETEDTTIADIAVGLNAGQIKAGAPCRTDRISKYNRLLNIEEELK